MKDITMSYGQLRSIMSLAINNQKLGEFLDMIFSGKKDDINLSELIYIIEDSCVDQKIIEILSGSDVDNIDAIDGIGVIADFFDYIRNNLPRLKAMLVSSGLKAVPQTSGTGKDLR